MLNIENHKQVHLHFNHVLKSTGETLPIIIKPIDFNRDMNAKKAIFPYDRPSLLNNGQLTAAAIFEIKYIQQKHYNSNQLDYAWAITARNQTYGFLDYNLTSLTAAPYDNWPAQMSKPLYNVLHRAIYLIPDALGQGIGSTACAVANDFLLTKGLVKPPAIVAHKFGDNIASMGLTKPYDGWQHVGKHNNKQIFCLLQENYKPVASLVPYDVVLPNTQPTDSYFEKSRHYF